MVAMMTRRSGTVLTAAESATGFARSETLELEERLLPLAPDVVMFDEDDDEDEDDSPFEDDEADADGVFGDEEAEDDEDFLDDETEEADGEELVDDEDDDDDDL